MVSGRKKIFIPIVLSVMLISSPCTAVAGGLETTNAQTASQSNINLEKAVKTVKQYFEIPSQYTEFHSNYFYYNKQQNLSLDWRDPSSSSMMNVQIDASTGEITNMQIHQHSSDNNSNLVMPSLTKTAAQEVAADLLKSMNKDKLSELELQSGNIRLLSLNSNSPSVYGFYWQRTINNIPFLGDGITIQVDGNTGKVIYYSQKWSEISTQLPNVQKAITADKAQQIFKDNTMLQLQYYQTSSNTIYGSANEAPQVKLVYGINNKFVNGAIDGLSGESIKPSEGYLSSSLKNDWLLNNISNTYKRGGTGSNAQEQNSVDNNTGLISQNDAVKSATQWINLPEGVILQNASLSTGWIDANRKVWQLMWGSENPGSSSMDTNFSAAVDASTGELLNFDRSQPSPDNGTTEPLNRESAQQIADSFLQKIQPERSKQVKLRDERYPVSSYEEENGTQSFSYYRIVNDTPYSNNEINITIDTKNKCVIGYNFNWSDLELPSTDGIISADQANTAFLSSNPLTLCYAQMHTNIDSKQGEIKLVYVPNPISDSLWSTNYIEAKNGNSLGWNGQSISQLPKPFSYTDISGNFAEKDITLLGQAGIFGEYNSLFKPSENLSIASMLRAMLTMQNGIWSTYSLSDQNVLENAQKLGWVSNSAQLSDLVDREKLAQLIIHFLKLDNVAQLDNYKLDYSDASSISKDTVKDISLAAAIGIFHFDGDKFNSKEPVTRAEAAYALVKALTFAKEGGSD